MIAFLNLPESIGSIVPTNWIQNGERVSFVQKVSKDKAMGSPGGIHCDSVKQSEIRDNSGKRMEYMNKDIVNHIIGREDAAVTQTEVVVQYSSYYSDCSTVLYIIILYSK